MPLPMPQQEFVCLPQPLWRLVFQSNLLAERRFVHAILEDERFVCTTLEVICWKSAPGVPCICKAPTRLNVDKFQLFIKHIFAHVLLGVNSWSLTLVKIGRFIVHPHIVLLLMAAFKCRLTGSHQFIKNIMVWNDFLEQIVCCLFSLTVLLTLYIWYMYSHF